MNTLPKKYNFFRGQPTLSILPSKEVLEATTTVFNKVIKDSQYYDDITDRHPLQYGPDMGNLEVRQAICDWNNRNFNLKDGTKSEPNCITLTNGASYGVLNILAQTTSPHNGLTKRAFLVTPTYFLINDVFIDAGFGNKLSGVEEFDNGQIDLDGLVKQLEYYDSLDSDGSIVNGVHHGAQKIDYDDIKDIQSPKRALKKIYKYVLYVTPIFSNPRGGTLTHETKIKLIDIARKYDMLIISDDVYDLLDYSVPFNETPKHSTRLVYLDRATIKDPNDYGNTASNATFSKLVGPGLRVGWQETATPALVKVIDKGGAHISGGSPAHTTSMIVGELITSGVLDTIIKNLRKVFAERSEAFLHSVKSYLPKGTRVSGGNGGYFLWVTLPDGYDCRKITKACGEEGVVLANGDYFEVIGDVKGWGKSGVRISISFMDTDKIVEGVKIWGKVCKESQL